MDITPAAKIEADRVIRHFQAESRFAKTSIKPSSTGVNQPLPIQLEDRYRMAMPQCTATEAEEALKKMQSTGLDIHVMRESFEKGFLAFDKGRPVFLGRRPVDDVLVNVSRDEHATGALRDRYPPIFKGSDDVHITRSGEDALHILTNAARQNKVLPTVIVAMAKDALSLPHIHDLLEKSRDQVRDYRSQEDQELVTGTPAQIEPIKEENQIEAAANAENLRQAQLDAQRMMAQEEERRQAQGLTR
jgi:hypothetical protein